MTSWIFPNIDKDTKKVSFPCFRFGSINLGDTSFFQKGDSVDDRVVTSIHANSHIKKGTCILCLGRYELVDDLEPFRDLLEEVDEGSNWLTSSVDATPLEIRSKGTGYRCDPKNPKHKDRRVLLSAPSYVNPSKIDRTVVGGKGAHLWPLFLPLPLGISPNAIMVSHKEVNSKQMWFEDESMKEVTNFFRSPRGVDHWFSMSYTLSSSLGRAAKFEDVDLVYIQILEDIEIGQPIFLLRSPFYIGDIRRPVDGEDIRLFSILNYSPSFRKILTLLLGQKTDMGLVEKIVSLYGDYGKAFNIEDVRNVLVSFSLSSTRPSSIMSALFADIASILDASHFSQSLFSHDIVKDPSIKLLELRGCL